MGWSAEQLASRVAADIKDGWIVNLGVGLPTLVIERLVDRPVLVHAENGILGVGPPPPADEVDPDIIDPGKSPVTIVPGASFMDSLTSFTLIRGGHLELSVMGAFQVGVNGDLANWRLPNRRGGAIGGAADLAAGAKRVWAMTTHTTKDGAPKLVQECTYPITARGVVDRVYTDFAVLVVNDGRFEVVEVAPEVTLEQVREATDADIVTHFQAAAP